jgi:hypothetical protein
MNVLLQLQKTQILTGRYNLGRNGPFLTRRLSFQFQLPEKYKGTRIEKWFLYWKNLVQDYREVGKDTLKDIRLKPLKACTIFGTFVFAACSASRNPDSRNYRDTVLNYANDIIVIGDLIRNVNALNHMKFLERCYNNDVIRYFSFGIFSIIWISNHDKSSGLYEAQCSYTKIPYLEFYKHIIDIGFWNKWWILENKMKDYDVSSTEWPEDQVPAKEDKTLSTGLFYNFPLWPARETLNKSASE